MGTLSFEKVKSRGPLPSTGFLQEVVGAEGAHGRLGGGRVLETVKELVLSRSGAVPPLYEKRVFFHPICHLKMRLVDNITNHTHRHTFKNNLML